MNRNSDIRNARAARYGNLPFHRMSAEEVRPKTIPHRESPVAERECDGYPALRSKAVALVQGGMTVEDASIETGVGETTIHLYLPGDDT